MQYIAYNTANAVGYLALNRPSKANAYHQPLLRELQEVLRSLPSSGIKALVLHNGTSPHFCAGADLGEIAQRTAHDGIHLLSRQVFEELATLPLPTVAAIRGAALGGGLELALACDLRLGTPDCQLGFPETAHGLIPAAGGCTRASLLMGPALAKEMIIFGRRLSGAEALHYHLFAACAPAEELLDKATDFAQRAAAHDSLANELAKQAIDRAWSTAAGLEREGLMQAVLYERKRLG